MATSDQVLTALAAVFALERQAGRLDQRIAKLGQDRTEVGAQIEIKRAEFQTLAQKYAAELAAADTANPTNVTVIPGI